MKPGKELERKGARTKNLWMKMLLKTECCSKSSFLPRYIRMIRNRREIMAASSRLGFTEFLSPRKRKQTRREESKNISPSNTHVKGSFL